MFHGDLFGNDDENDDDETNDQTQQQSGSTLPGVDAGREMLDQTSGQSVAETATTVLDPSESVVANARKEVAKREARQDPSGQPGGQQTGREVIQRPDRPNQSRIGHTQTNVAEQTGRKGILATAISKMRDAAPDTLDTSSDPDPADDQTQQGTGQAARNTFTTNDTTPAATTNATATGQTWNTTLGGSANLSGSADADTGQTWTVDWSEGGRL